MPTLCCKADQYRYTLPALHSDFPVLLRLIDYLRESAYSLYPELLPYWTALIFLSVNEVRHGFLFPCRTTSIPVCLTLCFSNQIYVTSLRNPYRPSEYPFVKVIKFTPSDSKSNLGMCFKFSSIMICPMSFCFMM